jgi:TetR/AcrR family tetracycline transcriptional repressor
MGRPKVALISKRRVAIEALRLLDTEGIDALSVRRLAQTMNVRGQSLYYHFSDKNDILVSAIQVAFEEVHPGEPVSTWRPLPGFDWKTWVISNAHNTRQMLRRHPNLIPILVRQGPLQLMAHGYDASVMMLLSSGAPIEFVLPVMSALEWWALGSVVAESEWNKADTAMWKKEHPHLFEARAAAAAIDSWFENACRAIVEAIIATPMPAATKNTSKPRNDTRGRRTRAGDGPKSGTYESSRVIITQPQSAERPAG